MGKIGDIGLIRYVLSQTNLIKNARDLFATYLKKTGAHFNTDMDTKYRKYESLQMSTDAQRVR